MIVFFYFDNSIRVYHNEFGFSYEHKFDKAQIVDSRLPFNTVYFSTPSDFQAHLDNIQKQVGEKAGEVHIIDPPLITEHPAFPLHIGFHESWDAMVESIRNKYPGKKKFSLAILNAMSNAIGDHLIGMQAFDYYQERLREELGEVDISFYQLNPYRVAPITKQWHGKYQHLYMLPNRLERLMQHDLFVDLGTLLLRENFDNQPMIDFFFESLSIDSKSVPEDRKRICYRADSTCEQLDQVLNTIRSRGKPILLFHRTSTSPIRQMSPARARQMISEIVKTTDYFVVSADRLEYQNKNFMDLSRYSQNLDQFVSIISKVDAVITVDTCTYHFADAFNTPTVALFTTINPEYRVKYYPFVESVMLEEEGGRLYGHHKASKDEKTAREEVEYVDQKWAGINVSDVLEKLEIVKQK